MKKMIPVLLFSVSIFVSGQNLHQKAGVVEIKMISHVILENKEGDLTKRMSNIWNRPYKYLYLDTLGNLIKEVKYGKYHNHDLLDYVIEYKYDKSKVIEAVEYENSYENNIKSKYKTEYHYNEKNQLVKEIVKYYDTDSVFSQSEYIYDDKGNQISACDERNTCYVRTFNNKHKIKSLQQIWRDSLRWEYRFTYMGTMRIGKFKTYYNDGKNHKGREIVLYKNKIPKLIKERGDYMYEKKKYYYDKSGLIIRVKGCKAYDIKYYIDIEIQSTSKLTKQMVKQTNKIILHNAL